MPIFHMQFFHVSLRPRRSLGRGRMFGQIGRLLIGLLLVASVFMTIGAGFAGFGWLLILGRWQPILIGAAWATLAGWLVRDFLLAPIGWLGISAQRAASVGNANSAISRIIAAKVYVALLHTAWGVSSYWLVARQIDPHGEWARLLWSFFLATFYWHALARADGPNSRAYIVAGLNGVCYLIFVAMMRVLDADIGDAGLVYAMVVFAASGLSGLPTAGEAEAYQQHARRVAQGRQGE